jgi:hypothetical protein
MKKKILSEKVDSFGIPKPLMEMARIGDYGQYSFWVYTEPMKNPSFHLKHKTDFEIVFSQPLLLETINCTVAEPGAG